MASMSYCVLENTSGDFSACIEKLQDMSDLGQTLSDLSVYEQRGARALYNMLENYQRLYEELNK